jgi:hypothetical protein
LGGGGSSSIGTPGMRPLTAPNWTASLLLPDPFAASIPPPESQPADILIWYGGAAVSVNGRNILLPTDAAVSDALLSHSARRAASCGINLSDLTQTLVDTAGGGGVAVLADCYPHPRLVSAGGGRAEVSGVSGVVLPTAPTNRRRKKSSQQQQRRGAAGATEAEAEAEAGASALAGAVVVLSRPPIPRQAGRPLQGTGERVWSKTAAGGLDAVGSAFSGTLLRMLQTSQTTLAELVDKLPEAVWAQSETKQVTFVVDGLGDDARRMYVTEE